MKKSFDEIKFSISPKMAQALIDYNNAKKQLDELKEFSKFKENKDLLRKIKETETKILKYRNTFIEQFRLLNVEEIKEYLEIKNKQNNS